MAVIFVKMLVLYPLDMTPNYQMPELQSTAAHFETRVLSIGGEVYMADCRGIAPDYY